ncbi:MAG: TMF family protein [Nitrosopumilales archaeon]|nr:MAG: TMF family protein [Nitrosopumilales archaeon]
MKMQHIVLIAVVIAVISLGLQVASNTKLQSDIKNINFRTSEHDVAIQHLTVGLSERLQMSDLKNKTAEQDALIQSLSSELSISKQIVEKNNATITRLQQNTEHLNTELKSLSERLASLEHKTPPPPTPASVNTITNPIVKQSTINVTSQNPFPINQTISMTKPDLKILSIAMYPNPLKVGDKPKFTVTFQNISDKEIQQNLVGCGTDPSLHWDIYPSSSVQNQPAQNNGLTCPPIIKTVKPNDVSVASGYATGNGLYKITKADELNVILKLNLEDGSISGTQATIKFNVTATR